MTHPLHVRPLHRAEDLGSPIPDSPHAISVCLPTWADIIGYEEKDPRVVEKLRTGYPRFFFHPLIQQVRRKLSPPRGHDTMPFAGEAAARECARLTGGEAHENHGVWAAYFPENQLDTARAYWQHAGRILSTRAAEDWLAGCVLAAPDPALEQALRERLARWSGAPAESISIHPSGMSAIYAAFQIAISRRPRGTLVMFGFPYTDTLKILQKYGAKHVFYPRGDAEDLRQLTDLLKHEEIAGIFCEFPGNPLLNTPDLPTLHKISRPHGVPITVDDTIGTFFNVDVLPFADLVATSLTKAVSGEGDVMAGSLTVNPHGLFADTVLSLVGDGIYVRDLQVLEKNSRTFPERMVAANANAQTLARWLHAHPAVKHVWYPGLDPSPVYEQLRKPGRGYGAVLSFLPQNAAAATPRIYESLEFTRGISLGTTYTLVSPYVQLAHYHELAWANACGIDPFLLRVAVGTEPAEDLLARFARALEA
jgi:cystathionine gamma-synthase